MPRSKRVPNFWWDYRWLDDDRTEVVVESDDAEHPVIARLSTPEQASRLIADLNAGRIDYRRHSQQHP